jgi:ribonuclease P protein component
MKQTGKLRFNYEFSRIYRKGRHVNSRTVIMHYLKRPGSELRVGIAVGKRLKGAVKRNRVKRLLRESFRLLKPGLCSGYDIVLTGRALDNLPAYSQIEHDMLSLFKAAGLWQDRCDEQ